MTLVVKVVNSIRPKALQHRLFKALLDELDSTYGDLLLKADVRWLSGDKVLQRFVDLLPEKGVSFKKEQGARGTMLLDLGFLTESAKLNF